MNITEKIRGAMRRIAGVSLASGNAEGKRRTVAIPSILNTYGPRTDAMPKPSAANLRRFSETPVARKAINTIKDRIAGMRWRIQPRRGLALEEIPDGALRVRILTQNFDAPNPDDSFRSLAEQVLEDVIVGGFGAIELQATVREVQVEVHDLEREHSRYKIRFADDFSEALGFEFEAGQISDLGSVTVASIAQVGTTFLADLAAAEITQATSTTVSMDAGITPPAGGGIEVRRSDFGWGQDNDRNLVGRFATQTFTAVRLSRVQGYFLRQYDSSNPPKYSRYSAALHIDYPL